MWKLVHGILPTKLELVNRTGKGDPMCEVCGNEMESLERVFFLCSKAQECWKHSPIQWDGLIQLQSNFVPWWNEIAKAGKRKEREGHMELTVNILWQVWKARNKVVFRKKLEGKPSNLLDSSAGMVGIQ